MGLVVHLRVCKGKSVGETTADAVATGELMDGFREVVGKCLRGIGDDGGKGCGDGHCWCFGSLGYEVRCVEAWDHRGKDHQTSPCRSDYALDSVYRG